MRAAGEKKMHPNLQKHAEPVIVLMIICRSIGRSIAQYFFRDSEVTDFSLIFFS